MKASIVAAVVLLVGCGDKGPDVGKVKAGVDVAAVNALVPAGRTLEFEVVVTEGKRAVAVAPKGWKKGFLSGQLDPPDGGGWGFGTNYRVSTSCDGMCTSKDWSKLLQTGHLQQVRGDGPTLKDEAVGTDGWLVMKASKAGGIDSIEGLLVRWRKGGSKYHTCGFSLADDDKALAPAFEAACRALVGLRWDARS